MKQAKITADNGDEVSVEPSVNGTVVLKVRPDVPARLAVAVELDEVTTSAVADVLAEARRSARLAAMGVTP
jgi:ribosomal protein L31E